jgi:hypothetical protein
MRQLLFKDLQRDRFILRDVGRRSKGFRKNGAAANR